MRITEVEIVPIKPRKGVVAYASCVFNGRFYLGDIAIVKKEDGRVRLSFPAKVMKNEKGEELKDREGKVRRFFSYHPINKETYNALEEEILSKAKKIMKI